VEAGNVWFADRFYPDALVQVLESRPDLVSEWADSILEGSDAAARYVTPARSFYTALCRVLLRQDPDTGKRLYQRLNEIEGGITVRDALSKIRVLDYALFEAPATDSVRRAWTDRLEGCTTDQELMHVAIVAQRGNGQDWLQSYIDQRIDSSAPMERSRALTLLGFMETQKASEHLGQLAETEPETWIGGLVKTSLKRSQTNSWARHWFERFLTSEDDVNAWAAFRLFLHCVDSRFWLWQRQLCSTVEEHPRLVRRMSFWEDNSHTIEKRIRKNEKDLNKHLFGQKAKPGQAWPWM
jgi:hypothetical protein